MTIEHPLPTARMNCHKHCTRYRFG